MAQRKVISRLVQKCSNGSQPSIEMVVVEYLPLNSKVPLPMDKAAAFQTQLVNWWSVCVIYTYLLELIIPCNLRTSMCFLLGMFDKEKRGTIDLPQFQALFNYVNAWLGVFRGFDHDNSGSIQESELSAALTQMGYRFSPDFIRFLIKKSDFNQHESIGVDQFIVVCVQIQRFTGKFLNKLLISFYYFTTKIILFR